jgi:hypothetical protein
MALRFSDGVQFDTGGELRIERRFDGLYVVGRGMLMPIDSRAEGEEFIAQRERREAQLLRQQAERGEI